VADFGRIENHRDLEALAQVLLSKKVVAIDTEADSFYHYFDKTCLVQIATRSTRPVWFRSRPGSRPT
jgi:ribonuclease D